MSQVPAVDLKSILDSAAVRLRGGNPRDALPIAQRGAAAAPQNPRAVMLLGIAQAMNGDSAAARRTFEQAKALGPKSPLIHYNSAVLALREADADGIKDAETALTLDPRYVRARLLADAFRSGKFDPYARFDSGIVHRIDAIAESGPVWTRIGWALVVVWGLVVLLSLLHPPFINIQMAGREGGMPALLPRRDAFSLLLIFFAVSTLFSTWAWYLTDMVDRQARSLWILPMLIGCFCGGFVGVAQAFYLVVGRK